MTHHRNRRNFLKRTAAAGVGFWVAGRTTWADELANTSPNERINLACIGVGGKGDGDCDQAAMHANLIAICDVDEDRLAKKAKKHPRAEKFTDFRRMFDALGKQIDAVTVSTPDHTHAVATMQAIKMGKHVYTQKPLTHDVWEARQLRLAAREYKVMTQMGNQGTSSDVLRGGVEVIAAGTIGSVKEVHVWTDRPTNYWPQSPDIKARAAEAVAPQYLHFDQWLGTAPRRPYVDKYYHPFNWRGWWDFGSGALGDMGCHEANLPFMALKLGHPQSVIAECEEPNPETYPAWARVTWQFPQRQDLPPVKVIWYEGKKDGELVRPPGELTEMVLVEYNKILLRRGDDRVADGKKVGLSTGGSIMVGDKGLLYSSSEGGRQWELLPADDFRDHKPPAPTLPRNPLGAITKTTDEGHKAEWFGSIKSGPRPMSNFDYSGMLSEFILLGNVAIRAAGAKLEWDGPNMKFPNAPQAERFLKRQYREPWAL